MFFHFFHLFILIFLSIALELKEKPTQRKPVRGLLKIQLRYIGLSPIPEEIAKAEEVETHLRIGFSLVLHLKHTFTFCVTYISRSIYLNPYVQ